MCSSMRGKRISVHGSVFLAYDVVKTSKSGNYILAYSEVFVVGNGQDGARGGAFG
jgi:hypothetical protein